MPQTTANSQPMARAPKNGIIAQGQYGQQQPAGVEQAGSRPQTEPGPGRPGDESHDEGRQQKGELDSPEAEENGDREHKARARQSAQQGKRRLDQALPFPVHRQRRDQPEQGEKPAAQRERAHRRSGQEQGRGRANPQVVEAMARHQARRACGLARIRRRAGLIHE